MRRGMCPVAETTPAARHVQAGQGEHPIRPVGLRQQSDIGVVQGAAVDHAGLWRMQTGQGAQQRGLASAVRADHGGETARREQAGQSRHRCRRAMRSVTASSRTAPQR